MESFSGFHIIQQATGVLCMPAAVHVTWIKVMETLINSLIGVWDVGRSLTQNHLWVRQIFKMLFIQCFLIDNFHFL